MNGLTTIESKRRAVAPIIATLLMVAIAVVGGILIFVFTQGFFADEQVVGPTVDNIRIFGYNATEPTSDNGGQAGYTGTGVHTCGGASDTGNDLRSGDCITIFIENLGDKPVAIQSVRIFGETYTPSGLATCATNGGFDMTDSTPAALSILEPNTQANLCVAFGDGLNAVKAGRTIPVQVETSNGQSSQINIINGATRGFR